MRYVAILNRDSGRLRTADLDAYCRHLEASFSSAGHTIACVPIAGSGVEPELARSFGDPDVDGVIAAGGDGTVSVAATCALVQQKPLGIIPAGTMNLVARSLSIPDDLHEAAEALATAGLARIDIALANGRPFLHQFAIGFHPRIVRSRSRLQFRSRLGKIVATVMASIDALRRPPVFPVRIIRDDDHRHTLASAVSVSNNLYGEGHLPYADRLDEGVLGLYITGPISARRGMKLLADLTLGTWKANVDVEAYSAERVILEFPRLRRHSKAVIDGELHPLPERVDIEILRKALTVLVPARDQRESA
jgi:diacylglycerol kinase family enzyme